MKRLIIFLLLLTPAVAAASFKNETFTANDSDPGKCVVLLSQGTGRFSLTGTFGSGTAELQFYQGRDPDLSGTWVTIKSITALASPNVPDTLTFGAPTWVRVILTAATGPSLTCDIAATVD